MGTCKASSLCWFYFSHSSSVRNIFVVQFTFIMGEFKIIPIRTPSNILLRLIVKGEVKKNITVKFHDNMSWL